MPAGGAAVGGGAARQAAPADADVERAGLAGRPVGCRLPPHLLRAVVSAARCAPPAVPPQPARRCSRCSCCSRGAAACGRYACPALPTAGRAVPPPAPCHLPVLIQHRSLCPPSLPPLPHCRWDVMEPVCFLVSSAQALVRGPLVEGREGRGQGATALPAPSPVQPSPAQPSPAQPSPPTTQPAARPPAVACWPAACGCLESSRVACLLMPACLLACVSPTGRLLLFHGLPQGVQLVSEQQSRTTARPAPAPRGGWRCACRPGQAAAQPGTARRASRAQPGPAPVPCCSHPRQGGGFSACCRRGVCAGRARWSGMWVGGRPRSCSAAAGTGARTCSSRQRCSAWPTCCRRSSGRSSSSGRQAGRRQGQRKQAWKQQAGMQRMRGSSMWGRSREAGGLFAVLFHH